MRRLLMLMLVVTLSGCGEEARLPPLADNAVILAFGDSLTAGNGAPEAGSYPAQLSRQINRSVINAGVSGEESAAGRRRLAALLDEHRPQLLLLCHGGNDLLRKRPITQLEDNLAAMIAMARDRGIDVVLLGVPAPGIFLSPEDVYERVAEATGVPYIPDAITDVLSEPGLKSDTVHPNERGYGEIADTVAAALRDFGAL